MGLLVVGVAGGLLLKGTDRPQRINAENVVAGQDTASAQQRPTRSTTWRVLIASKVRAGAEPISAGHEIPASEKQRTAAQEPNPGAGLTVDEDGCVLLASAREILILRGGRLSFHHNQKRGDTYLRFHGGRLAVQTLRASNKKMPGLSIRAGALKVRPMGTAFSLTIDKHHHLWTGVHRGKVSVSSEDTRYIVPQGQALGWGTRPTALDPAIREVLASELQHAQQLLTAPGDQNTARVKLLGPEEAVIHLDGFAAGRAPVTAELRPGAHRVSLLVAGAIVASQGFELGAGEFKRIVLTPAALVAGKQPLSRAARTDFPGLLREIEQRLAGGDAPGARARAQAALRLSGARKFRGSLGTLIAESHVQQRDYRVAKAAYMEVFHRGKASLQGADALYMAGSLALEQLRDPAGAVKYFKRYLTAFKGGRQRQGAYLLTCKALLRQGEAAKARLAARRYLQEFPKGQFIQELKELLD